MTHIDSTPQSREPLAPLGTTHRSATAVDTLAETYFDHCMALDPSAATFNGIPGHETDYPDYGRPPRNWPAPRSRSSSGRSPRTTWTA